MSELYSRAIRRAGALRQMRETLQRLMDHAPRVEDGVRVITGDRIQADGTFRWDGTRAAQQRSQVELSRQSQSSGT